MADNQIIKKISVKDQNDQVQSYDIGGDAKNIDYNDSNVKAKLDTLGTAASKNAGVANGVATLDGTGKVPASQLPTSQGKNNVVEGYRNPENGLFYEHYESETYTDPITGEVDIIYIDLTTRYTYMYDANESPVFVQIGGSNGGEGSVVEGYYDAEDTEEFYENYNSGTGVFSDLIIGAADTIYIDLLTDSTYRYDETDEEYSQIGGGGSSDPRIDTAYAHSQLTSGNPHQVTKSDIGLANVENYKSLKVSGQQELTQTEKEFAVNNLGLSMIHSLAKILDVSEENSVTFYDATISEDTIILGIYTNNGLLYSSIETDSEAHEITVTYDVTDVVDDFKVAIVYITDRTIITTDTISYLGIGKLLNVVTP